MARQMSGYVLIEKDLRSAAIWLAEINKIRGDDVLLDHKGSRHSKDRERYNLVKGLFVAALTFYGKAFSQCEGRRVKLERRQLETEFHEAHDEAISFRNYFAAHSGKFQAGCRLNIKSYAAILSGLTTSWGELFWVSA